MADLDIALRAKDETGPGIRSAENRLRRLGGTIRRDFGGAARVAGAALAGLIAGALTLATVKFFEISALATDLRNLSFITGISSETLHRWSIAARLVGIDAEKLIDSIRTFSDFLYEASIGGEDQLRTLHRLGLSYLELARLSPEDQIRALFRALQSVEDPLRRSALANKLFGESGRELIPLILRFEELELKAARTGAVLDRETIERLAELREEIEYLKLVLEAQLLRIVAFVFPLIADIAGGAWDKIKSGAEALGIDLPLIVSTMLDGMRAIWESFLAGNTEAVDLWLTDVRGKLEDSSHPMAVAMLLVWDGVAAVWQSFKDGNLTAVDLWLTDVRTKLEESESPIAEIALLIWDGVAAVYDAFRTGNLEEVRSWLSLIWLRISNSRLGLVVRNVWNDVTAEFRAGVRRSLQWVDTLIANAKRRLREFREGGVESVIAALTGRQDEEERARDTGGGSDGGGGGGGVGPLETASLLLDAFLTGRSILKRTRGTLGGKNRVVQTPVTPSVPIYSPPGFVPAPNLQPISVSLNIDGREFDRATVKAVNNGIRDGQVQVLQGA